MNRSVLLLILLAVLAATLAHGNPVAVQAAGGTIKGRVHLEGKPPGNPLIRMGMDPKCAGINRGKQIFQETVVTAKDGSLANVFVHVEGRFPATPAPSTPVLIDQRACVYAPHVVAARVGQTLQIRNDDNLIHNTHSTSNFQNGFNFGQARAGVVDSFKMKSVEMLRLNCDLHRWMTAYVAVVNDPYFAVTGPAGTFEIAKVPAGKYTVQAWHEKYGMIRKSVQIPAGGNAVIDFEYKETGK